MLRVVELQRVTLGREPIVGPAETEIPGVVMQAPTEDAIEQAAIFLGSPGKESAGPVEVVDVGAGSDETQVNAVTRNGSRETPVFGGILFGCQVSATAPRFIADTPVAYAKRIATRHVTVRPS